MPRSLALFLAFLPLNAAAIFPDQVGDYTKTGNPPIAAKAPAKTLADDQALMSEYGLDETQQAAYANPAGKKFSATAWRFKDATGAMAMFQAVRPAIASFAKLSDLSATTPDGALLTHGNYLFQITGSVPAKEDLNALFAQLPKLEQSPMPALMGYLPPNGLEPNSERYILGPVSLARFDPQISPSLAGFHLGAEGQLGKYRTPKGEMTLVVFNYPTPNMARERFEELQKQPGIVPKRTGPIVAAIAGNPDPNEAETLLSAIKYEANLTWNEKPPQDNVKKTASAILAMFALAGLFIGASIILGIGFGGFKVLRRKLGKAEEPDAMITLGIGRN
jgi:hypothetical protein